MADFIFQPPLVDCTKLLQQNNRIPHNIVGGGIYLNVRGQLRFIHFGCDCSTDYRRAVLVAYIILDNQDRPHAALLAADHRP